MAFRVLKAFTLLRSRDGSVIADGSDEQRQLPHLGDYHEGHNYNLTPINESGAKQAVAAKLAAMISK